ncbi:SRPBCC domain-containing protein [Aureimonas sp. AU20]|uniref:SRPBCC family protein n=1 Tax=Aureimonas sp. AU20 TaxID=1349819 RepID=UPI000720C16D|nr:hypothetical protein [Aureimonas sp. AU20]ALN71709.1 hypothetical protein M673_03230 [Aureimonas sp. AU20]
MSESATTEPGLDLAYEFDEPPEKLWRALSIPAFRDAWLPDAALAEPEPVSAVPGREISYRLREDTPPFLESSVTFRICETPSGGTRLRILHRLSGGGRCLMAANGNRTPRARAA